jgi:hypothetical protein
MRNGSYLDRFGNPVRKDDPAGHIPLDEFRFDPEVFG